MLPNLNFVQGLLTDTAALAAVALIGYLFGRRTRNSSNAPSPDLLRELDRARQIAVELRQLANRIRKDVALHQGSVASFQSETTELVRRGAENGWQELSWQVEQLLAPTRKLAADMSSSYEQLRRHTNELLTFTNSRTDPECGVHTMRALEEHLDVLFSTPVKPHGRLALVLFGVGDDKSGSKSPALFVRFAQLAHDCARENDFVARYGGDEVVVVMPETSLSGATIFGDRMIRRASAELGCIVRGGVVEKAATDNPHSLLSRADTALYSARTHDGPCLFQHTGEAARRCCVTSQPAEQSGGQGGVDSSSAQLVAYKPHDDAVDFCAEVG